MAIDEISKFTNYLAATQAKKMENIDPHDPELQIIENFGQPVNHFMFTGDGFSEIGCITGGFSACGCLTSPNCSP